MRAIPLSEAAIATRDEDIIRSTSTVGDAAERLVTRTRQVTGLPVCVGLGVSNGDQAAEVGAFADGVIVGSRLVRAAGEAADDPAAAVRELVEGFAQALR